MSNIIRVHHSSSYVWILFAAILPAANATSHVYFISRLFASVLRNDIDVLQLSETAPIVFAKHDGTQSSPI